MNLRESWGAVLAEFYLLGHAENNLLRHGARGYEQARRLAEERSHFVLEGGKPWGCAVHVVGMDIACIRRNCKRMKSLLIRFLITMPSNVAADIKNSHLSKNGVIKSGPRPKAGVDQRRG